MLLRILLPVMHEGAISNRPHPQQSLKSVCLDRSKELSNWNFQSHLRAGRQLLLQETRFSDSRQIHFILKIHAFIPTQVYIGVSIWYPGLTIFSPIIHFTS